MVSHGEGHGATFYIDIPVSKIEKGSDYKHTTPARTDVSSKNRYNSNSQPNSPFCSPGNTVRKSFMSGGGGSVVDSPAAHITLPPNTQSGDIPGGSGSGMQAGINPSTGTGTSADIRAFMNPQVDQQGTGRGQSHNQGYRTGHTSSERMPLPLHGPPVFPMDESTGNASNVNATDCGVVGTQPNAFSTSLFTAEGSHQAGSNKSNGHNSNNNHNNNAGPVHTRVRSISDHLSRGASDQSMFTAGHCHSSSRSSHGTALSSFSTDPDGGSSRTMFDGGSLRGVGFGAGDSNKGELHIGEHMTEQGAYIRNTQLLYGAHANTVSASASARVRAGLVGANTVPNTFSSKERGEGGGEVGFGSGTSTSAKASASISLGLGPGIGIAVSPAGVATAVSQSSTTASSSLFPADCLLNGSYSSRKYSPPIKDTIAEELEYGTMNARVKSLFEKKALIVDDSATNRKFVNRLLRTKIGTRDEAADGQEAVQRVVASIRNNAPYDVILMDYVMPVMDGPTATTKIRELGFKGVILGVTGNGHQADIDFFKNAGADKILIKPLSADKFYETLCGKCCLQIGNS